MNNPSRIDLYLQENISESYHNTEIEQQLVSKFSSLYRMSKTAQESRLEGNPANLDKWRKAYYGTLNALTAEGVESKRKSKQLKKLVYELVESKVDNSIPLPKMTPRYKSDLPLVDVTENYLKFEVDGILSKFTNDQSERATYVDGTTWYKVWWDSFDNSHERSGNCKIALCLVDQVIPQPGVKNYKELEYIFERRQISVTKLYDMYKRIITPTSTDNGMVVVVSCYYLNENHIVGHFMWAESSLQVICNEHDWQIRKLRKCTICGTINPQGNECRMCGNKSFEYKNAETEVLDSDLMQIYNPYEEGETDNEDEKDLMKTRPFLTAGTEIPFYRVSQLPFVPRPAVSSLDSIYGISEVFITLDMQDSINKIWTKVEDKILKSGNILTKPKKSKLSDMDETTKVIDVNSVEEANMLQSKEIRADVQYDIALIQMTDVSARSSSGITESFQGKRDTTATSGKAREQATAQTAGRIESLRVMKSAAMAGVYELVLKYLLAFSDEGRKFVKTLPDGSEKEMIWNKYMFLDKDKYGQIYYRDDFSFNSDPAATLSQDRVSMWRETQDKFIAGAFGNVSDPRVLKMFWNIMYSLQYPLAKIVIAGLNDIEQHLPFSIEQALMGNQKALQVAMDYIIQNEKGSGGARANSGPAGNGATHSANVQKTNMKNAAPESRGVSAQQISRSGG